MKLHEHVAKHPAHLWWLRSSGCSLRDLVRGSHHRHLLEQLNGLPCLMSCSGKILSIGWVKDKRPNFDQEFKRGASVRARKLVLASESAAYRRARRLDAGAPHKVSAQGEAASRRCVVHFPDLASPPRRLARERVGRIDGCRCFAQARHLAHGYPDASNASSDFEPWTLSHQLE
eukprot:CAMPEP_0181412968 /NCGR_PEP_ID=MMETSP1110-20121109/8715_1 /TAXON_ID=174948 /ORGANISM="Symbiodinium sp., Strain CCMP421" /LENGTH=173 /DNA_ID=CAMNT_0023535737 /DNA_START=24 /DNA_END=543 /DNA_ORIENTATION=-